MEHLTETERVEYSNLQVEYRIALLELKAIENRMTELEAKIPRDTSGGGNYKMQITDRCQH